MIFSLFDYGFSISKMFIVMLCVTMVFIVSLSFHEFAHAFVAYKQGDGTPKTMGRLTLNPLAHIDGMGFVSFLIIGVGWARPVPVNPNNFKKYRPGIAKVSIAGVVANLILCVIGSFLFVLSLKLTKDAENILVISMNWLMQVNAYLAVFNLIPLFPLDGFNFISAFMKGDNKYIQFNLKNAGKLLLCIIFVDLLIDLLFDISIIGYILTRIASWLYTPLCKLWRLIF